MWSLLPLLLLLRSTVAQTGIPKLVVAHHIVGLTSNYTVETWKADILEASACGIDGFALNIGSDSFQPGQLDNAWAAAEGVNQAFRLFISFDMDFNPCATEDDLTRIVGLINRNKDRIPQYKVGGKTFVSTFSGTQCTFGQADPVAGWAHFKQEAGNIYFVPAFFADPATGFNGINGSMDGILNWNGGWPMSLTSPPLSQSDLLASLNTDDIYRSGVPGKTYMAPASPWFYKHISPTGINQNTLFSGDQWLFATRWQQLVDQRDKTDIVQIVTWNDVGESHYIGPNDRGVPPAGVDYFVGFDHQGWKAIVAYYAPQFKTGAKPHVKNDTLVLWSRPHPANASAPSDPILRPQNTNTTLDKAWAFVLATSPAHVNISTGSSSNVTKVKKGLTLLSVDIAPGGGMKGVLKRDGKEVVSVEAEGFVFGGEEVKEYNYNAFVASNVF